MINTVVDGILNRDRVLWADNQRWTVAAIRDLAPAQRASLSLSDFAGLVDEKDLRLVVGSKYRATRDMHLRLVFNCSDTAGSHLGVLVSDLSATPVWRNTTFASDSLPVGCRRVEVSVAPVVDWISASDPCGLGPNLEADHKIFVDTLAIGWATQQEIQGETSQVSVSSNLVA